MTASKDNITNQILACLLKAKAEALSKLLEKNHVKKLDLSGKNLEPKHIAILSKVLSSNHTVKELILWGNILGKKGISELSEMLKSNHTLEVLDISLTHLSPDCGVILFSAFEWNATIQKILLHDNTLDKSDVDKIQHAVSRNARIPRHRKVLSSLREPYPKKILPDEMICLIGSYCDDTMERSMRGIMQFYELAREFNKTPRTKELLFEKLERYFSNPLNQKVAILLSPTEQSIYLQALNLLNTYRETEPNTQHGKAKLSSRRAHTCGK